MSAPTPSLDDYEAARAALPGDPRLPVDESAGVLRDRLAAVIATARAEGRRAGLDEERRRIIPAVEEAIGRDVTDGGQYRADIKSAIGVAMEDARAQARAEERAAVVADLRALLDAWDAPTWTASDLDVVIGKLRDALAGRGKG